jgi:hypothetical protein
LNDRAPLADLIDPCSFLAPPMNPAFCFNGTASPASSTSDDEWVCDDAWARDSNSCDS